MISILNMVKENNIFFKEVPLPKKTKIKSLHVFKGKTLLIGLQRTKSKVKK